MGRLELYIDGASKGNPGPAGIGVVVCRDGEVVKNLSYYIGENTNNFAEYTALIHGLEEALAMGSRSVHIKSDSQLLCRQMNGQYKVRHENIVPLYQKAKVLAMKLESVQITHIPREQNKGADALANLAIKKERGR